MILTLMMFSMFMVIGVFILGFMIRENKQSIYHQNKIQAYYIARSGVEAVEAAILDMNKNEMEVLNKNLTEKNTIDVIVNNPDFEKKDNLKVILSEDKDDLLIISTGREGSTTETITRVLNKKNSAINIDSIEGVGIYARSYLEIKNAKIMDNAEIILRQGATIKDNSGQGIKYIIDDENRNYPGLDINKIPSNPTKYYSADYTITSIDATDRPIDIVVEGKLKLDGLEIEGDHEVRIFAKNGLIINNKKAIGNQSHDKLDIFYYGNDEINIDENSNIYANIYVEKADIFVSGQTNFFGLIYAPNSKFYSESNQSVYGIIANEIKIENANLYPPKGDLKLPSDFLEGKYTSIIFSSSYYK